MVRLSQKMDFMNDSSLPQVVPPEVQARIKQPVLSNYPIRYKVFHVISKKSVLTIHTTVLSRKLGVN